MTTFQYYGRELELFSHLFNSTYLNERGVELAVAFDFLDGRDKTNGLEIGNVLSHYDWGGHVVVDAHEPPTPYQDLVRWPYHNVDVFDVATVVGSSWDWIVAISTLEHVRFDMDGGADIDLDASFDAITALRSLLAPGGEMLVTLPCGFHPVLDDLIVNELTGASLACTLVRFGFSWRQTDEPTVLPYGLTTRWAEAVWVGIFEPS